MGVTSSTPATIAAPRLRVVTRQLAHVPELVELADAQFPLVWTRGDRGCVGIGEVLRLTFTGPHRFTDAAAAWRRIADAATIDDPVCMPGSGLVALGTFTFADTSTTESVLIVPRVLVARHRSQAWITEVFDVDADPELREPQVPIGAPPGAWTGVTFADRQLSSGVDSRDIYLRGVREAGRRIDSGAFEKIVLARQVEGSLSKSADLRVPIGRLAERYLDCWTFAIDGFIGSSPETLIRSTEGAVSARVLAGTRGRHPKNVQRDLRARDELLSSAKEHHEHAFAVQSVVTALSPHVRDLSSSEEPFALQLPNVWHLATDLGAALGELSSAIELVGALHPTAAVAGTPTAAAVTSIAEFEPFDRGRYAGAVGWIDAAGDGEWVIGLRCAQIDAGDAASDTRAVVASAGGGIVQGSNPEHELTETISKLRPITESFSG